MSTPLKPGWNMTPSQCFGFWRAWNAACQYHGWNKLSPSAREEKRREVLAELGYSSAKEISATDGLDRVLKRLKELAGYVHNERPDAGERRRILWLISQTRTDLRRAGYSPSAVETILYTRFKIIPGARTIADLETSELRQLHHTLRARLISFRQSRSLVSIFRDLFLRLAQCHALPAPARVATSCNAPRTALARPLQHLFSPNTANVKPLFFVGS